MRRLALSILLFSSFSVSAVHGADQAAPQAQKHAGYYLTGKEVPPSVLPPPPGRNSRAQHNDLQQIIGIQTYVAPDEIMAAREEQNLRPEHMTKVLGETFNRQNLPKTFALLDHAGEDTGNITAAAKQYWHTTRAYYLDPHIKLQVDALPKTNYGYPSGHTSTSYVWAHILAGLQPDSSALLERQAERIALHRLVAGVHTPHDLAGGRKIGEKIVAALKKNPRFLEDFASARAEICQHDRAAETAHTAPKRKNWRSFKSRVTG